MKTVDLIKKKEEEKKNPSQETTTNSIPTSPKPTEGMSMAEARMDGNGVPIPDTNTSEQTSNNTTNPVSLYEVGKQAGNINQAENTLAGKSPITTPEYEKFRNEVIGAQQFGVETEEQKKKRERAEFIKQGLTGLTEGLSSLANLYYTTQWAPNQKQVSQMPALQQQLYRERLERDKKLENFRAWQRDKARRDEDRAYQEKVTADTRAYQDAIRKEQAAENRRRWDYTVKKQEEDKAKADARYEAEQAYKREQDEISNKHRAAQLAETQRYHDSMIANRDNGGKGSGTSVMHGKNGTSILNTKNGFMDVDWKKVDPIAKRQLYDSVPEEIRNKYPLIDDLGEYDEKYATNQMNAAIAEAAIGNENIAKWLIDSKAGVYQQQPQPIGSAKEKEQKPIGSKWDVYDVTGNYGKTDFSKQKRQREGTETASNVSQSTKPDTVVPAPVMKEEVREELIEASPIGNKYERMLSQNKKEKEKEKANREKAIRNALDKKSKTVEEAKEKRAELNHLLNSELKEFDIEKFISENDLGILDSISFRMEYADDDKKRAKIRREIERLDNIIGNR